MKKSKDVNYWCRRCLKSFPVKGFVAKDLKRFNKKAYCPKCGENDQTNKFGENPLKTRKTRSTLNDPVTNPQLSYIKNLGGDPRTVKTIGEAGELITKLKKEKYQ